MGVTRMAALTANPLGKTGITVTRLSAGGHFTSGPSSHNDIPRRVRELHHMIDSGITYFDVQWDPEELAMAQVLKTRKKEIAVAWPLHGITQQAGALKAQYIVDYCKEHRDRYGIDHVDILLWVALELYPPTQQQVIDELKKGFEIVKAQGFCDHLGFSCHHSAAMALSTIQNFDCFAVMMTPYSPLHPAAGRQLLPEARRLGIGTIAMKPFGGGGGFLNKVWNAEVKDPAIAAYHNSGRAYQAALKWVLQNPSLDCTVPGMHSQQQIDQLLQAACEPLCAEDRQILDLMVATQQSTHTEVQLKHDWD